MLTVWVDSWQVQCCGEPFSVGSTVTWDLSDAGQMGFLPGTLDQSLVDTITHYEDHHTGGDDDSPVTGTVRSIREVWWRYGPPENRPGHPPNACFPVPGSAVVKATDNGDPWRRETDDGLRFQGFLVELEVTTD